MVRASHIPLRRPGMPSQRLPPPPLPTSPSAAAAPPVPTMRVSTPIHSPIVEEAAEASSGRSGNNDSRIWDEYGMDENALTLRSLHSNLLLLGTDTSQIVARHSILPGKQIEPEHLLQSTEAVRLVTHFLLSSIELPSRRNYIGEAHQCFPATNGDKVQKFNKLVKEYLKTIADTHPNYAWPKLLPNPSANAPRYLVCLLNVSQICLIQRLKPTATQQERFFESTVDMSEVRCRESVEEVREMAQLAQMAFFKAVQDDAQEREAMGKEKEAMEQSVVKLASNYEHAKVKCGGEEEMKNSVDKHQEEGANKIKLEGLMALLGDIRANLGSDLFDKLKFYATHHVQGHAPSFSFCPTIIERAREILRGLDQTGMSSEYLKTLTLDELLQALTLFIEHEMVVSQPILHSSFDESKQTLDLVRQTIQRSQQVNAHNAHLEEMQSRLPACPPVHLPLEYEELDLTMPGLSALDHDYGESARLTFLEQFNNNSSRSPASLYHTEATPRPLTQSGQDLEKLLFGNGERNNKEKSFILSPEQRISLETQKSDETASVTDVAFVSSPRAMPRKENVVSPSTPSNNSGGGLAIRLVSPLQSVRLEQSTPVMPVLLTQIDSIDPW